MIAKLLGVNADWESSYPNFTPRNSTCRSLLSPLAGHLWQECLDTLNKIALVAIGLKA